MPHLRRATLVILCALIAGASPGGVSSPALADDAQADVYQVGSTTGSLPTSGCAPFEVYALWHISIPSTAQITASMVVNYPAHSVEVDVSPTVLSTGSWSTIEYKDLNYCAENEGVGLIVIGPTYITVRDAGGATSFWDTTQLVVNYSSPTTPSPPATKPKPSPTPVMPQAPTHFHNCAQMHVWYIGGVEKRGAHNKGKKLTVTPTINTKLYNREKSLDRDHDGIACEV